MSDEPAIAVKELTKEFVIPHKKSNSLKQLFVNFGRKGKIDRRKVLNDISFDIKKGEFFGIVGRNGSGKSTLLKLLAGVYTPTKGLIQVNGSLTPFIELGVGFNPELTGRENVFLNGALLGFTHRQMKAMYKDIVDFAELKEFMDQKLKNYSSGMQVRLAFSIAIRAKSDILLIDEVLAVGDAAFQKKCFDYFRDLKEEKRTVVFVTHDMSKVQEYCDRALMIEKGDIASIGQVNDIASMYLLSMASQGPGFGSSNSSYNKKEGIELIGVEMKKNKEVYKDDDVICFSIKYKLHNFLDYHFGISITKNGISLHEKNTKDIKLSSEPGDHHLSWSAPVANLNNGLYYINIAAFAKSGFRLIAYINEANKFIIEKEESKSGGFVDMNGKWGVGG